MLNQNARIVAPVTNACDIKVINARVTSPGATNNHRGYRLNGQQQVTLQGSRFERGSYGLYTFNPTLGNSPHVNNCEFADCGIGMYSLGKAVSVYGSLFKTCKAGLLAEQVSQTSKIINCDANGNSTGIFVQGSASLLVLDPEFDFNVRGLVLEGMDTRIECGSISDNTLLGIHLKYSGTLRMDGTIGQEHPPLTALNNPTTISLLQANNVFLNLGNNSLRPLQTGIGKTLNGTLICGPWQVQSAYRNNWEGTPFTPLTSAEYAVVTCAVQTPVIFDDPFGADETPCGQALTPCPNPPCVTGPELDAFVLCPSCREIETDELGTVDLNIASFEAKLLGDDDTEPANETAAIDLHAQILMNDLENPTADEAYLVGFNYNALKESYSDALEKGQLIADPNDPVTDEYVGMITEVQDKRMDEAEMGDYYELKLFSAIDKAQTLRAAGKYADAVAMFDAILTWVGPDEEDMVSRLACLTVLRYPMARLNVQVALGSRHERVASALSVSAVNTRG
ncbi:MAG: right-handed parallel beta-helix repeat-containing protein [Flavobacteriales bacterium]|nr:right-handed parallel beta-helix repeat-containing protein [Flavobacteriales bacterium]